MSNKTQIAAHMALVDAYGREASMGDHGSCMEARAAVEASARQLAEQAAPILTITGYQLHEALEFLAPDGEAEQLEQSVCIQHGPERTHEEGTDPAGLYCWLDDCPEEGSIPLTGDDARIIEATMPQQAAPGFVMVGYVVHTTTKDMTKDRAFHSARIVGHFEAAEYHPDCVSPVYAARPLTASRQTSEPPKTPVGEQTEAELQRTMLIALHDLYTEYCNVKHEWYDRPDSDWSPERDDDKAALAAKDLLQEAKLI